MMSTEELLLDALVAALFVELLLWALKGYVKQRRG
jgi:hypothetical protein